VSASGWEVLDKPIKSLRHETARMRVEGGWLYRATAYDDTVSVIVGVGLTFVPDASSEAGKTKPEADDTRRDW
jgi:hypothetical protein